MYLCDYHMHSNHSTDAKDAINKMCGAAIRQGFQEIAITDHFEPTLGDESYAIYDAEKYFREIREAQKLYGGLIKIKAAVELGQPHLFQASSHQLLAEHHYDYVLASAHKMPNNTDYSQIPYNKENLSSYCAQYLAELTELANWNEFDCLGHLDLVKRYAANYGLKVRLMEYREKLEQILKTIIANGKGIEVNTSGLRQASQECLPNLDIIRLYKELGGEIITIGSDSHNAGDVGKGVVDALELIQKAGFDHITVFNNRKPAMIKISSLSGFGFTQKLA